MLDCKERENDIAFRFTLGVEESVFGAERPQRCGSCDCAAAATETPWCDASMPDCRKFRTENPPTP